MFFPLIMVLLWQAGSDNAVSNEGLISTAGVDDEIARAIGLFMGRGRRYSVSDVAMATGLGARSLQSYIASGEERRTPSYEVLFTLMQFFGPQFTSKVLGWIGQGAHSLTPQAGDPGMVIATLAQGVSQFAIRGADNHFCHVDQGALEPVADELIATLVPFSSKATK
jgi:transcriptional regulator with XRE-family HTH domain